MAVVEPLGQEVAAGALEGEYRVTLMDMPLGVDLDAVTERTSPGIGSGGVFERNGGAMARCDEMREGEVYCCEECGLEIQVIEECSHEEGEEAEETCRIEGFVCCGQPLTLKED